MATRNLIPRGSGEGGLGIETTPWGTAFFNSGNFVSGITVGGNPVPTGFDIGGDGGAVIEGDDDNINFGGTDPADARDINFMQGGENVMIINEEGNVNIENNMNVSGTISGVSGIFDERVGIGTTSPNQKLDVAGNVAASSIGLNTDIGFCAAFTKTNKQPAIKFQGINSGVGLNYSLGIDAIDGNNNKFSINRLDDANGFKQNVLTIKSNGNVGIGTTNPAYELEIQDSSNDAYISVLGIPEAGIVFGDTDASARGGVIYDNDDNALAFRTNDNTEKMRIDSSGNVGIGTRSPDKKLEIFNGALKFGTSTAGLNEFELFPTDEGSNGLGFYDRTNGDYRVLISNDGNVGIGTTSPSAKLDVFGSSSSLKFTRDAGDRSAEMLYDGSKFLIKTPSGDRLSIADNSSNEILTVNPNNGNVGIGTTSPAFKFDVSEGKSNSFISRIWNTSTELEASGLQVRCSGGAGGHSFAVYSDDAYQFTIKNNGNVGIGTTSPGARLEVKSVSNLHMRVGNVDQETSPIIRFQGQSSGGQSHYADIQLDAETGTLLLKDPGTSSPSIGQSPVAIDSAGNVGIGTTNPVAKLEVENDTGSSLKLKSTGIGLQPTIVFAGKNLNEDNKNLARIRAVSEGAELGALAVDVRKGAGDPHGEAMRIDSAGNVGIGTTNPDAQLHLKHNIGQAVDDFTTLKLESPDPTILLSDSTNSGDMSMMWQAAPTSTGLSGSGGLRFYRDGNVDDVQFMISTDGKVGIGTTSPDGKLEVNSDDYDTLYLNRNSTTGSATIVMKNNGDSGCALQSINGGGLTIFNRSNAGVLTPTQTIDSSGNVGLGTTNPSRFKALFGNSSTLSIGGTKAAQIELGSNASAYSNFVTGIGGLAFMNYSNTGSSTALNKNSIFVGGIYSQTVSNTTNSNPNGNAGGRLRFYTKPIDGAPVERMRIDDHGNVGIGTTNPDLKLEVAGAAPTANERSKVSLEPASSINRSLDIYSNGVINSYNTNFPSAGSGGLQFQVGGITYLNIKGGDPATDTTVGNVGIGTTNPGANRLQVVAGVNTQPLFVGSDSGSVCTMNRATTDGHILRFEKNGVLVGHVSTNSNSLPSDRNFKRNITDLKLGLDFVSKLKPSVYNYKIDDEDCPVHYGLIAQDVESALEECGVEKNSSLMLQHSPTEKEEESDYSLDYGKLVPVLTKAIQEQQTIIEDLKSRIVALEGGSPEPDKAEEPAVEEVSEEPAVEEVSEEPNETNE